MGNRSALRSCLTQNVRGNTLQRYVDYAVNLGGVVGCWPLNEASGGRRDFAGDSPLTDNNTVTGGNGPAGGLPLASQFTAGSLEYLSRSDNPSLSVGAGVSMTVCVLVYFDSLGGLFHGIVKKGDDAVGTTKEYGIQTNVVDDVLKFDPYNNYNVADGTPTTATWYFIIAWLDAVAVTHNIQVNNGAITTVAGEAIPDLGGTFTIGATILSGLPNRYLDGRAAGALLVKRVLQRFEAQRLYELGMGRIP